MISYKGFLYVYAFVQAANAQCGEKCGLYGGMPSVATLNFHTKDCQLEDGSWINLDCPVYKYSTLWNLSSFSDVN
eukprot:scaffold101992_cov38-Cyclotella_meneghiniana.AAC.1